MERAAKLLNELPVLWTHHGVTENQRESLIEETLEEVPLRGSRLAKIKPKPEYQPLFASVVAEGVSYGRGERI